MRLIHKADDHVVSKKIEKEFLQAYDLYADAIYRYCYFRVYQKQLAEDLTQETFFCTWKYISEGKTIHSLKAFLYITARNLLIDGKRQKKPFLSVEDEEEHGRMLVDQRSSHIMEQWEAKSLCEFGIRYKNVGFFK